jgi:LacI family transcriptional regulator
MATITDVARQAGVSISTVSHVVNGTRPVSPDTRRRVQTAIDETGYLQDGVARALRRARTDSVGLVISDTGQPAFAEMVRGVESEARAAGMNVLLADSREDRDLETRSVRTLRERRVDGLLVAQVSGSDRTVLAGLRDRGFPVILLDRLAEPGFDQVGVETVAPMRALVRHLIGNGHERIGIVAGDLGVPTLRERFEGYALALAEAGIAIDERLVVARVDNTEDARAAVQALLSGSDRPTALVGASVVLSAGALGAANELRLRLPDDLAFVAFDEFPYADLFAPRLTTVVQPAFEVGREAMKLLIRRLKHPRARPLTVRLEPSIAHRASCGCSEGMVPIEWRAER